MVRLAQGSVALLGLTVLLAPPPDLERALASITPEDLRAHVYFLSHDLLRGRAPGTRGGEAAATYVAGQLMRAGVQPVGGTYFQRVPVLGLAVDADRAEIGFEAADATIPARYGDDVVVWPTPARPEGSLSAEVVFVGYGTDAPEYAWDDFKGRDVRGRLLLFLVNDPPAPPDEPDLFAGRALTYYGRWAYKLEEARRRGAAGALLIHSPESAGYGWSVVRSSWTGELLSPPSDTGHPLALEGWITSELTRRVLDAAGLDLDELRVLAARRDFRPIRTGVTLHAYVPAQRRRLDTQNVVGLVPGHGPKADEVVVVTSHYDHLGVAAPDADGDSVYNGAYDNASGVALLLEVAEALAGLEPRPRRSLLFLATTAEEAGLLGSRHYVRNPLLPLARTVAVINIDGANLWGETDDVVALGDERSTLGTVLREQARALGLLVAPDPAPEKGLFYRSDHFPFARAGVPALHLQHGLLFRERPRGWGPAVLGRYEISHYHRLSDEYDPAFDFGGAVQQARLTLLVAHAVAAAERRPAWLPGAVAERP